MTDAPRRPPPPIPGKLLGELEDLIRIVEQARPVPLSSSAMINREEFVERLQQLRHDLPEELRAARWMVRERETYVARTNEKAREVIAKAKAEAERLVSESTIVEEAVVEANTLVRNAEAEARQIRLEAEDFADQRLAEAEVVLADLVQEVRAVRTELHQVRPPPPEAPISE